jgi:hypothetical protein
MSNDWRNWKAPASAEQTGASSPSEDRQPWRQSPPPVAFGGWRIAAFARLVVILLACATALVWLLFWLAPPGPAALVLVSAGYEDNLAISQNAPGRAAVDQLAQLASSSAPLSELFQRVGRLRLPQSPTDLLRGGDWARGVDSIRENTVIVFLAMHGAADRKGAYLLPHDASADPGDRLRMDRVIDRLGQLPAKKQKLLILDPTGLQPERTLGVFHNDFVRALLDLEPQIQQIPNLVVLLSTDLDQHSWLSPDLRTSLFMRHFIDGLVGNQTSSNRANRPPLDALTLFRSVRSAVQNDARRLYGAAQEPLLLPREGGEERARAISLTFKVDPPTTSTNVDPLPIVRPTREEYAQFTRKAAALACTPRDFGLWQSWLTRYEQLRILQSPNAPAILQKIQDTALRVRQALDQDLSSRTATLTTRTLLGYSDVDPPEPFPPLERLWQFDPEKRQAGWQSIKETSSTSIPLLRHDMLVALLKKVAVNPARNLRKAGEIAKLLDDPLRSTRPAEAHFLVQLSQNLAARLTNENDIPGQPQELQLDPNLVGPLADALTIRRLAERAAFCVQGDGYPYAEQIWPQIAKEIQEADTLRENAQDLLFSSEPQRWKEASALLAEAKTRYEKILQGTISKQQALAIHDRACNELNAHQSWVPFSEDDQLVAKIKSLLGTLSQWERTEQLDARLDLAKALSRGLDEFQAAAETFAQKCESAEPMSPPSIVSVLRVQTLPLRVRERLIQRLYRLPQYARSVIPQPETDSSARQEGRLIRRASDRGQIMLAGLGPDLYTLAVKKNKADDRGISDMDYADVETFIRRPDFNGTWSKILRFAGDNVGTAWRRLPDLIDEEVTNAYAKNDSVPLRRAERLARRLSPGQAQTLQRHPTALARAADLAQFLVAQAERTRRGGWYADDPQAEPYFRIVGQEMLRDAEQLDPFRAKRSLVAQEKKALLDDQRLVILTPKTKHMVGGDVIGLNGEILPPGDKGSDKPQTPPAKDSLADFSTGHPVIRAALGEKLSFVDPADARVLATNEPQIHAIRIRSEELDRAERSLPPTASVEPTSVQWLGYWRGQKIAATTPVMLHPAPESLRVDYARPAQAGLAVRADGQLIDRYGVAQGGITFVVDCSGSLGPVEEAGGVDTSRSRYRSSLTALRKILASLPRGVRVSVWTFGERSGGTNPEETIRRIQPMTAWTGKESQIDELVRPLESLEPWNFSAIAHAMLEARADLEKISQPRAMIVLSDGDDNRFAKDKTVNPTSGTIAEVLNRRFEKENIAIHMLGFAGKDGKPEESLEKNFAFVTKRTPAGVLTTIDKPQAVIAAIRRMFIPGLQWQLQKDTAKTIAAAPVDIARVGDNDTWFFLEPMRASYRFAVPEVPFSRNLKLAESDLLLLQLSKDGKALSRLTWSKEPEFARRPHRENGAWRSAVMQNQLFGTGALQMLMSVERQFKTGEAPAQVYPGSLWLELKPNGTTLKPVVRWGTQYGFPAPSWGVDVAIWPTQPSGPCQPRVQLWWGEDEENASAEVKFKSEATASQEIKIAERSFTIDPVRIEEHWVQTANQGGIGVREKRWCVVVNAHHEIDSPSLWATLLGMGEPSGQEHRHHRGAGRYVGLFWFAEAAEERQLKELVKEKLTGLKITSVEAFCAHASHEGKTQKKTQEIHRADFENLDIPAAVPERPRTLWSTK